MAQKAISVLIVDDSFFMRQFLTDAIERDPHLRVAGTASDPFEARDKIVALQPDVMTLDVEMPRMNGINFLQQLIPQYSMPVLIVSSTSNVVFDAIQAGAVDFIAKSDLSDEQNKEAFIAELLTKIKIASIARIAKPNKSVPPASDAPPKDSLREKVIALGASTGGTEATYTILKDLRSDLPGIVMVQHMPPVFTKLYAERLNNTCPFSAKEAQDGDDVLPGRALVAPGDHHMQLVKRTGGGYSVRVFKGDKVSGHCPSVDVLFSSVAKVAGSNALGILLTGMGSDGAKGMLEMKRRGAPTIGQDQNTCVVYGMPMMAKKMGAIDYEMPLEQIAGKIYGWHNKIRRT